LAKKPRTEVIIDNLRAHYRKEARSLIEARGCSLLYLPPYSPHFSPIEFAFSKIQGRLKSLAARSKQGLTDAVARACCSVSSTDAAGWFRHCGYSLQ
jgi:transposase